MKPEETNIPTHWEMAQWLAQGKGEMLDTNNFNRVIHSFDYRLEYENKPLHPLELAQYKIRLFGDPFWHQPDTVYMDIPRWNIVKFIHHIAAKFPEGTFPVHTDVLHGAFHVNDMCIACSLGVYTSCKNGKLELEDYRTHWDAITDDDVIRIEKVIRKLVKKKSENT